MSSLAVFDFDGNSVRVFNRGGNPWFVAKDLCLILDIQNIRQNLAKLDEDEKGVCSIDTLGGKQDMAIVSESGMYALVLSSRKPEAKPFRKWVTSEVLPSIRKTGSYSHRGKSPDWIEVRQEGKDVHRTLTDAVQDYIARHPELSANKQKFMYSNVADAVNRGLFGLPSKQLKALLSLTSSQLLRDGLEKKEIHCLTAIEFLVVRYIDVEDLDPCLAVKKAIEASYTNQLFAEKYLSLKAGE